MKRIVLLLAALVCSIAAPAQAARTGTSPERSYNADACRPGRHVGFTAFHAFGHSGFDRLFRPRVPIVKLGAELGVRGYDFIGNDQGYALFYRRPLAIYRIASLAPALSPQGFMFSAQVNPELNSIYPPPFLLVQQWPFEDGIILPQQIVAFPCGKVSPHR